MKLYVLNGPNLNMLGIREPDIYGNETYDALTRIVEDACRARGVSVVIRQSNHEGDLIDWIQEAFFTGADGIVINPGGYTHTSVALLDALKAAALPVVEVHLSDLSVREDFRQVSYVRRACLATIMGKGIAGYVEAIDRLIARREEHT